MSSEFSSVQIRVLLVSNQRLSCDALQWLINADDDFIVVGKTIYSNEALNLIHSLCPDLILLDVDLPNDTNILLVQQLSKLVLTIPIVVIMLGVKTNLTQQLLQLNIQACLTKDISGSELLLTLKLLKKRGGKKFCHLHLSII